MPRRRHHPHPRAFSLVEAAISTLLVATMFAAGMSAAGTAARDRSVQREMRTSSQLARLLMAEITAQRYADPAPNTIAPFAGINTTNRTNWTHIDDYHGLSETTITDRDGTRIRVGSGYSWKVSVAYVPVSSPAAATGASGGLLGGLLGAVGGTVSSLLDTTLSSPTDTGLKKITVTVLAPSGKSTVLTALRCSSGPVDRTSTGFKNFAAINITVGDDAKPMTTGAPLLNTPATP